MIKLFDVYNLTHILWFKFYLTYESRVKLNHFTNMNDKVKEIKIQIKKYIDL